LGGRGRYRNRLQIVVDILSVAEDGASKTRIMYQVNLSYKLLCKYLTQVLDAGMLSFDGAGCYRLTRRGQDFLDKYEKYVRAHRLLEEGLLNVNNEKMFLEEMVGANSESRPNKRAVISKVA